MSFRCLPFDVAAPSWRARPFGVGLAALAALLAGGCALRADDVRAAPDNPAQFAALSCERLDEEAEKAQRRAADVAWAVDERAGNNVVALGVGVAVFWPALLALRPQGPEADELARLKGRFEALREAAVRRNCPPPGPELPAARAAQIRVASGERLVYEVRTEMRGAMTEDVLVVRGLRREEIEYALVPAAAGGGESQVVRQDRNGNVIEAPIGRLTWPRLLRSELALGQVMAGEIQVAGDPLSRARVRAQVVALGPQRVGTRQFDAAVLELFGDVLLAAGSTRLEGAMVVDRASGALLRLDLRSAQPPFHGMRRLVRVEPAAPAR